MLKTTEIVLPIAIVSTCCIFYCGAVIVHDNLRRTRNPPFLIVVPPKSISKQHSKVPIPNRLNSSGNRYFTSDRLYRKNISLKDSATSASESDSDYYQIDDYDHENYNNDHNHHHDRVVIKVYRGPDDHEHHFAPHAFWIQMPSDHGY